MFRETTDQDFVLSRHPEADIGVGCIKYSAWFRVMIPTGKTGLFSKNWVDLGTGDTVKLAWKDAADRIRKKESKGLTR